MSQTIDYGEFPLATPPPGEVSNFIDPPTRDIDVYTGMGIMLSVASISMMLHLYTRLVLRHAWALEDFFVWVAWVVIVTHDALTFTITGSGPGRFLGSHEWNLKVKYLTKELQQRSLAAVIMFSVAALFVKLSLFSLYLRLFRPNLLTRKLIYFGAAICSLFYLICLLTTTISCVPDPRGPNDTLTWLIKEDQCSPVEGGISLAQGVFGTVSDIYLFMIPIQMVARLQLALNKRIGIGAVFLTGILAIACSMVSLVLRGQSLNSSDQTWFGALIYVFSNAEVCAGIICVNTPLVPAIFSQPAKKPIWLRLPENMHYFSRRWTSRGSNSGKPLAGSAEGITLHQHVSVEHGVQSSSESVDVTSMPAAYSGTGHGRNKEQYYVDISGGVPETGYECDQPADRIRRS